MHQWTRRELTSVPSSHEKEEIYDLLVEFITQNQQNFYRFAYQYTHNEQAALDVVSNAVYKALTKYKNLREIEYLKTWFYRILINESKTYLRKNKRLLPIDEIEDVSSYQDHYQLDEWNLYEKINQLPEKFKTIIILRFYEEMTLEEISIITKSNLNTVKSRLYKALKLLKLNFKEGDFHE